VAPLTTAPAADWRLAVVLVVLTGAAVLVSTVVEAPLVGLAIMASAGPVVALCLGSGVVPFNGPGIIPFAGIVLGGSMTAATLSGRRAFHELASQTGTYEAALALGLPATEATRLVVLPTAREDP
jgi:putative ABC transport system permease protein